MENLTEKEREKERLTVSIVIPLLFVSILWLLYFAEGAFQLDLTWMGVYPRHLFGLIGIIFTPFLHGSFSHLASNSVPLVVLGGGMIYFYRTIAYRVFLWIWLIDGLGVWLLGREAYHIGASGLVYGMASFLFFSGVLRKNRSLLALSLVVVFIYGSLIWGMFPYVPEVSWEAHLFGFLAGIYFSIHYLRKGPPNDPLPDWMLDDEAATTDGEKNNGEKSDNTLNNTREGETIIHYSFRRKDQDKEEGD